MYVVVGAGTLGYHLTRILLEEEHDVVVIEQDPEIAKAIGDELECVVVKGDATKPRVLDEAGVKDADAVIALTSEDETNMIVCMLAKQKGTKMVACRLRETHYDDAVLQKLSLDIVIYPEAAAAGYISELITKPDVIDLAFIERGEAEIAEIVVRPTSNLVGKKLGEIDHPKGTAIIGMYDEEVLLRKDPNMRIREGDKLIVLAKTGKMKAIRQMLGV
ncbi:MAG: NAD-binding protein [Candidatus Diapherotrites archaeon]|nr:NAD-binding protein [Candidatus Diapherotrites archaeon]